MILVCGGAGYIGSHTCVELLAAGYDILVADNLSGSSIKAVERVREISGKAFAFSETDLRDRRATESLFWNNPDIDAVIHFAAFKAVGESMQKPLAYHSNNVGCTLTILNAMRRFNVKKIVFSSSASVYGDPRSVPIREDAELAPTSVYGMTKLINETILRDIGAADPAFRAILLRYFNPIGAHESGLIGDDPRGIPNNLLPYIARVAGGKLERLSVFGNDYDTPDGTGIRDYIHVVDLAKGHVAALKKLDAPRGASAESGSLIYNLGTGKGHSVLEIIAAFSKACGRDIPYKIAPRRSGDVARCYADPAKAEAELGWKAERGLDEMCADAWNRQQKSPAGDA